MAFRAAPPGPASLLLKSRELFPPPSADRETRQALRRCDRDQLERSRFYRSNDAGVALNNHSDATVGKVGKRGRRAARIGNSKQLDARPFLQQRPVKCVSLPTPVTAMEIFPGSSLARAISSGSVETPSDELTATNIG